MVDSTDPPSISQASEKTAIRGRVNSRCYAPLSPASATHDLKVKEEIERLAKGIWQAQGAVGVCGEVKLACRADL